MRNQIRQILPTPVLDLFRQVRAKRYLTSSKIAADSVGKVDDQWQSRIENAVASPDNSHIKRCSNAGRLEGYTITMHNGVRLCANGYYGAGILNMLIENRGVHEPQEERAFESIIQLLPEECVMLELGAYWAFYSLSLLQQRPKATCFLVEPEAENITAGRLNFSLNKRKGNFFQSRVDRAPKENPKTISVDSFCRQHNIEHLDILHADIQGSELDMLDGASGFLANGKADYIFISTHSNELHVACIDKLQVLGYEILADANMEETFSVDGLIVAKHKLIDKPKYIEISKRVASEKVAIS